MSASSRTAHLSPPNASQAWIFQLLHFQRRRPFPWWLPALEALGRDIPQIPLFPLVLAEVCSGSIATEMGDPRDVRFPPIATIEHHGRRERKLRMQRRSAKKNRSSRELRLQLRSIENLIGQHEFDTLP